MGPQEAVSHTTPSARTKCLKIGVHSRSLYGMQIGTRAEGVRSEAPAAAGGNKAVRKNAIQKSWLAFLLRNEVYCLLKVGVSASLAQSPVTTW